MKIQQYIINNERDVSLTAYLADDPGEERLPAILIIPGGGYRVFSEVEAEPPAIAYHDAGFQTFVLRYTVGEQCHWPLPLEDYEAAMELIIDNADDWHVDRNRIVLAGFSAGGHLAACAATLSRFKPAAAILAYPVILPDAVDSCLPGSPYPEEHVTASTCPFFFVAARDDDMVDVRSTLAMQKALADHGVPFESHIYSHGGHAFATGESSPMGHVITPRLKGWVPESVGWLKEVFTKTCLQWDENMEEDIRKAR